jgi:hypothetical protein
MARYGFAFFDSGVRFDAPDAHPTHMIKFTRFFENPFDDEKISLPELLSFSTDHLERMIANNPSNELDARITATTSALGLLQDHATDDNTSLGARKARKQVKDAFRKELPGKIAKIGAAVAGKFGPDAPEMTECFPQGRTPFGKCTDDQVATHIQTLIDALGDYQPDLAGPLADATALKTTWDSVYDDSETSGGAKTATQQDVKLARENLQLMLFLNLLKLAEMFARQPEKLGLYMKQSLLEDHPHQQPPTPPQPPTP